jgi:hypothetical protein
MAEFLLVEYPTDRAVWVDDQRCGFTNTPIQVGEGHHKIDLGPRANYTPPSQLVEVRGCPYEAPKTISFSPK